MSSPKKISQRKITTFQKKVWAYYGAHKRAMPWREGCGGSDVTPYHVVVSEIMLQQTQAGRVVTKYEAFIQQFPDWAVLAAASTAAVITAWQGLGYNRRALALKKIAEIVVSEYNGELPNDTEILQTFPGIGPATTASIVTYAFNTPVVFIETNVRTVFIHEFFPKSDGQIHDKELAPLVEQALDHDNPRQWYWALMDYGAMLKEKHPNPSRRSAHHTTQSSFKESDRYIRGQILKILTTQPTATLAILKKQIDRPEARITKCLAQLEAEGFIVSQNKKWQLVS